MRRIRGFTLVELLVVVAIIAVLMAVLLPSLVKAKEQAARAICGSNMRAQGLAQFLYAADYNDNAPFLGGTGTDPEMTYGSFYYWPGLINVYSNGTAKAWVCPKWVWGASNEISAGVGGTTYLFATQYPMGGGYFSAMPTYYTPYDNTLGTYGPYALFATNMGNFTPTDQFAFRRLATYTVVHWGTKWASPDTRLNRVAPDTVWAGEIMGIPAGWGVNGWGPGSGWVGGGVRHVRNGTLQAEGGNLMNTDGSVSWSKRFVVSPEGWPLQFVY